MYVCVWAWVRLETKHFSFVTDPSKPGDGRLQITRLTYSTRLDIWWIPGSNKDKEFIVTVENRTDIKPSVPTHSGSWYTSRIYISYGSRLTINIQAVKHGKKSSPLQLTGCTGKYCLKLVYPLLWTPLCYLLCAQRTQRLSLCHPPYVGMYVLFGTCLYEYSIIRNSECTQMHGFNRCIVSLVEQKLVFVIQMPCMVTSLFAVTV